MQAILDWFVGTGAVGWIVSVLLVGLFVNLLSNFIQRWLDAYLAQRPSRTRTAKIKRETALLLKLSRLYHDPVERSAYIATQTILCVLGYTLVLIAITTLHLMRLVPDSEEQSLATRFLGLETKVSAAIGYAALMVIVVITFALAMRLTSAFLGDMRLLRSLPQQEAAYIRLVGTLPIGYVPTFRESRADASAA